MFLPHLTASLLSESEPAFSMFTQVWDLSWGRWQEIELVWAEVGAEAVCFVGTQEVDLRDRETAVQCICVQNTSGWYHQPGL